MTFRRTSKACELCRERKTRCFPGPTGASCGPCTSLGAECQLRAKPRIRLKRTRVNDRVSRRRTQELQDGHAPTPSTRSLVSSDTLDRSRIALLDQPTIPSDPFSTSPQLDFLFPSEPTISFCESAGPGASTVGPRRREESPLIQVEDSIRAWARRHNIPDSHLLFDLGSRLSTLRGPPTLPTGDQRDFEDALIHRLVTSPDFGHLNIVDHWSLSSLYRRYVALPDTVNEDQRAFIMASLCIIRYSEIRLGQNLPALRHDVTFYNTATMYLRSWSRPSRWSFAALFCLVPYTFSVGGPSDTRALLERMAWHAQGLGLNRQTTAKLYASLGMLRHFFAVYVYSDVFRATLTDCTPCINLAEIEVDCTPPSTLTADCLIVASKHTATLLSDRVDPTVDTMCMEYIEIRESEWCAELAALRHGQNASTVREQNHIAWVDSRTQRAWAELRYNWLRLLLHIPLLDRVTSVIAVTRSVTQILHTYSDLDESGNLEPSWPQAQRLLVCGQLLVLCQDRGETQGSESADLWARLLYLLGQHTEQFPICVAMCGGFRQAIDILGMLGPVEDRLHRGAQCRGHGESESLTTLDNPGPSQIQIDQMGPQVLALPLNIEQYGGVGRLDQIDVLPFDEFSSEFFSTLFSAMNDGREGSGPLFDFE